MSDTQQGPDWWQASDGRWYPPQPSTGPPPPPMPMGAPPATKKKGGFGKGCLLSLGILAAIGVVIVIIVVVVAGKAANNLKVNANAGNLGGSAPAAKYSVGQTATTSKFAVTVYSFKDPLPPPQYVTPTAGDHYVEVDVQMTNTASTQQTFSSLIGLHLLDSSNHQYDETVLPGVNP